MSVGRDEAQGGRGLLLLFLLAACCLDCWSATQRHAETSGETDGGLDGEAAPEDEGGEGADGDGHAEADADVTDVVDTPEDDGGAPSAIPCTDDAPCSDAGLVCNENWGICVVASCAGQPDFQPCELITTPSDRAYDICVDEACVSPGCGDATCNAPGPNWTVPDTNQRFCCVGGGCPGTPGTDECATTPSCGQDTQYGWDVTHAASERFTRTEGEEPVVTDNVTGLVWQGCYAGQSGATCDDGFDTHFAWEEAVSYCDSLSWNGFTDWGLPSRYELQSIVDYGVTDAWLPSVDAAAFPPGAASHEPTWSSSSCAASASDAWYVQFNGFSEASCRQKTASWLSARCVRLAVASVRAPGARFTRTTPVGDDQPVVTDAATGLVWQGCAAGQTGLTCSGSATFHNWEWAPAYCEALEWGGHTDWYLPNIRELASIADDHQRQPSIDAAAFPNTPHAGFWSSSDRAACGRGEYCGCTWTVNFFDGRVTGDMKNGAGAFIRCVRLGP